MERATLVSQLIYSSPCLVEISQSRRKEPASVGH